MKLGVNTVYPKGGGRANVTYARCKGALNGTCQSGGDGVNATHTGGKGGGG